jgi:hypothetical protein
MAKNDEIVDEKSPLFKVILCRMSTLGGGDFYIRSEI